MLNLTQCVISGTALAHTITAMPQDTCSSRDDRQPEVLSLQQGLIQKERELAVLTKLNRSLSAGYLEHLLSLIVNLTTELIDCTICSINLLDPEKNELVARATQSLDDEFLKRQPVPVDNSLSGVAILERRPIQWYDILSENRCRYPTMAQRLGLKSLLCVPMMVKARPIGVINYYTTEPRRFSYEEVGFLEAIASQAASALERHELAQKAKKWKRALEERKRIERSKGIIMENKGLSEKQAYQLLRNASMSQRKSMCEIADAIILAEEL